MIGHFFRVDDVFCKANNFMRKFFFAFMFSMPFLALAQMRIAVRAGINFASISFKEYKPEKRILPRINIGTMIEIPFDENWLLYTGPYYSGKGVIHGRSTSTNKIDSTTIRLNYIELPLNIAYKFSSENENRLTIAAGPYLSYGFNGQISTRNSPQMPVTHLHKKETEKYKRLETGVNLTTLYEIKSRYGIRLDYSRSLFNIRRFDKQKNNVFGFSFFWYLNKKKETEE